MASYADTRCLGRLTKWSKRLPFGDNKHYFTLEYRCTKSTDGTTDLCAVCQRRPLQHKETNHILHGRITDPIPDCSSIYGGSRYVEFCKKFGEPSAEHVETAQEAHKLAIEGYSDPGMAKEGRQKQKSPTQNQNTPSKMRTSKSDTSLYHTNTQPEPQPAHAIEITVKPTLVEVERVKARRCRIGEKEVVVDEEGRVWDLDEKGAVRGLSSLPLPLPPAKQVRSEA